MLKYIYHHYDFALRGLIDSGNSSEPRPRTIGYDELDGSLDDHLQK